MKLVHLFFLLALYANAQSTPDARYVMAFRDGARALDQDALLSARASFNECLAIRPNDPAATIQIARIDARLRGMERSADFRRRWPALASIYAILLLLSLFFGLRREQQIHNL